MPNNFKYKGVNKNKRRACHKFEIRLTDMFLVNDFNLLNFLLFYKVKKAISKLDNTRDTNLQIV